MSATSCGEEVPVSNTGKIWCLALKGLNPPTLTLHLETSCGTRGRLDLLLKMTKLSYGSPTDWFAHWLAQPWALNLKKSFHPLLNTAWISLFVLQGSTQYTSETWIYTTIHVPLMTFQMPLIPYVSRFSVGSEPVSEFWAHWPPSDTRADPHAHALPQPPHPPRFHFWISYSLETPIPLHLLFLFGGQYFIRKCSPCNYKSC